jgi:hypothetical protein
MAPDPGRLRRVAPRAQRTPRRPSCFSVLELDTGEAVLWAIGLHNRIAHLG